jgi:hypothetical protein
VAQQYLPQLYTNAEIRVQRLHRVLENDANSAGPQRIQGVFICTQYLLSIELDTSAYAGLLWQQAQNRERRLRLARSRFSDKADRLTALDIEVRTVDDGSVAVANGQSRYVEQAHSACLASK